MFCFKQCQRIRIFFFVQQHGRQAQPRHIFKRVFPGIVDDPLQLGLGARQIMALLIHPRSQQLGTLGISGGTEFIRHRGSGIVDAFGIVAGKLLDELLIQSSSSIRLFVLVILPTPPATQRDDHDQQRTQYLVAVVIPPRLQGFELFLFLQIQCCHVFHSRLINIYATIKPAVPHANIAARGDETVRYIFKSRTTVAVRSCTLTRSCSPPCIGFTLISFACASSSPITTATRAPLASAFFICDLKLPPPQCNTTRRSPSRNCSATRLANWPASSP